MRIVLDGKATWVNYHHLYCFYVIAQEGGLTAASKALGIGQSALSIQMRQFEEQLGFPLFERAHRRITPNEQGKIVLSYASEIFRLGGELVQALHDRPAVGRTHVQIGALDTIPKHLTAELVTHALKEKNCSVSVLEGKPEDLLKALAEHRIDLVLTNFFPTSTPARLYTKRIARLALWIVGGRKFLKLRENFPKSISGHPFILPTGDSHVRHEFENFCRRSEIHPDRVVETQDVMVQKLLAIRQLGLTVVPQFAAREYLEQKDLFLIGKLNGIYEELFLISASRKIENPVASSLMKTFQLTES